MRFFLSILMILFNSSKCSYGQSSYSVANRYFSFDAGAQSTATIPFSTTDTLWTPTRMLRFSPRFTFAFGKRLKNSYFIEGALSINTSRLYYGVRHPEYLEPPPPAGQNAFYPGSFHGMVSIYQSLAVSLVYFTPILGSKWHSSFSAGPTLINKNVGEGDGPGALICIGGRYCSTYMFSRGGTSLFMPGYHTGASISHKLSKRVLIGLQYDFYHQVGAPHLYRDQSWFVEIATGQMRNYYDVRTKPFSHSFGLRFQFLNKPKEKKD